MREFLRERARDRGRTIRVFFEGELKFFARRVVHFFSAIASETSAVASHASRTL
jgi:hypothetical protein